MAQPRALGEPADIEEITVTSPERQRQRALPQITDPR
jgi:hypothetical protein